MCPATEVAEEKKAVNFALADRLEREGMIVVTGTGMAASYPPEVRTDLRLYESYMAQYAGNDPRSFAATLRMLARQDIRAQLATIRCPVTVLAGRYDQGRPPAVVRSVADIIPGAQFRIVESAHFMMIQTPALVAEELNGLLR
jgi:3-oxoadipate enol-lactonase